jgi:hypothetical protein
VFFKWVVFAVGSEVWIAAAAGRAEQFFQVLERGCHNFLCRGGAKADSMFRVAVT